MAHQLFGYIINALENKLVSVENDKEGYGDYFNSWHPNDSSGKTRVFSRNTRLTLRVMFWLIVSRIVQSLPVALDSFFSALNLPVPLKSAFSMKRTVIKSSFFRLMGHTLTEEFYKSSFVRKWRNYVLVSCDGSRVALPEVEELGKKFGWYHTYQGEELYPSAKACVFQDTLNNITLYAALEPKDKDERYSFEEHFEEALAITGQRAIMLLDRGYFSYLTIYLMIKRGVKFVMKTRRLPWAEEFIRSGRKQGTIRIHPSKATSIYGNRDWRKEPVKELTVRLVRFDHPDGSADVLVTNLLPAEGITCADIIGLYRLRWPVETSYGIYKNEEALELFSSFRPDGVLQDFHAAVILFNLASILDMDCDIKHRDKLKPDMNVIIGLIHNLCPVLALGPANREFARRLRTIADEASHYKILIMPGRSFPRVRRKRKTSGKFFRHTNFSLAV